MRLLMVLIVALACLAEGPVAQQSSWPQFRGNPQLTGVTSSPVPSALKVIWTFDAGDAIESSAAIADGAVFIGSAAGELVALDLQSGAVRWRYRTTEIGESSPAVADGVVYIGDLSGVLHAVDVQSGKARWTFKTAGEIRSSPVVVGARVLIGSYDRFLYGLSVERGTVDWKVEFDGYVHATPAVADGVAYISGCDERFHGVRVADGKEVINVPIGAYMGASTALTGGAAYVGTFENEVIGIDMKSRKLLWEYRHPERRFPFYSSAAVSQGTVVLGGRDKMIHALDAKTGKARWTFMTNARVESSPAIAGTPRVRGVERRPSLCPRSVERRKAVGVRRRCGHHRIACDRRRPRRRG